MGEPARQVHGSQRVLEAAVLGGREHPARRLELRDAPQALHPRGIDQILLGGLSRDTPRPRVLDVLVNRIRDEASSLVGVRDALHGGSVSRAIAAASSLPGRRRSFTVPGV